MSEAALLEVEGLSLAFGGLKAVDGFGLSLGRGEVQGLIGPNGAGKTTVFNLLTAVYRPDSGSVKLAGRLLNAPTPVLPPWLAAAMPAGRRRALAATALVRFADRRRPHYIARAGMARTFQNIRLFGDLSVLDNVRVACHLRCTHSAAGALMRTARHRGEERAISERARQLLALFELDKRRDELARNLAYGDQRRLEIARAVATNPRVLLLDEPAAGMNSQEKRALAGLIRRLQSEFQLTMLLIDHDVGLIMGICGKITVLDYGQVIASGKPAEVQNDARVIEAYLGEPVKREG